MKCLCPACGRTTQVPPDLLEFLIRCERCGALLRARLTNFGQHGDKDHLVAQTVPIGRWREDPFAMRSTVLDVLTPPRRPPNTPPKAPSKPPAIPPAAPAQACPAAASAAEDIAATAQCDETETADDAGGDSGIGELVVEAAQVEARRRALRRAELRTSYSALGWISACGAGFLILAGAGVILLKMRSALAAPRGASGNVASLPAEQNAATESASPPGGGGNDAPKIPPSPAHETDPNAPAADPRAGELFPAIQGR